MKSKNNIINNIKFLLKKSFEMDKSLVFSVFIRIPITILIPFAAAYLSKLLITLVSERTTVTFLLVNIITMSGLILLMYVINNYVTAKIKYDSMFVRLKYLGMVANKNMKADFEIVESPDGQLKAQKAKNTVYSADSGVDKLFDQIIQVLASGIGIIVYSIIIFKLNIWIVVVLFFMTLINYYLGVRFSKWQHNNKDNWTILDRKLDYLNRQASDYKAAKDIRMFHLEKWFREIFSGFLNNRLLWWKKEENQRLLANGIGFLLTFFRDGFAYGLLIYQVSIGKITISDFIFYFTIITQYSKWIIEWMDGFVTLKITSLHIGDLRDFLEMPGKFNREKGEPIPAETCDICFDNVSYHYPNSEKNILDKVSFSIEKGEKLAIVGVNGAGKTTLIKLLCRLYTPTQGAIYLNGKNISLYNIEDYYSLFSVVFQDIYLMPTTIAKNITLVKEQKIDYSKLDEVLELSGLINKIKNLSDRENTFLMRGVRETGIDLSGGEIQKLALARALYKGGKIIILDEPTAALDPIAENEIYLKYKELTLGCTSLFISHRLSSTRFCDRILFFENGRIVEEGSHEELMNLDGKYAAMFRIQSQYYKKDGVVVE